MGKIKGSAVLLAVKLLRNRREQAAPFLPPRLAHYLDERIVVASWYPEEDLVALIKACQGAVPEVSYEVMGAMAARGHLEGVYADLLRRRTPTSARTLWKTQHDSGVLSITAETPHSTTYELVGWDHASIEYCRLLTGYFAEAHRLSGEREPTADHPRCRAQKHDRCTFVVRWRAD